MRDELDRTSSLTHTYLPLRDAKHMMCVHPVFPFLADHLDVMVGASEHFFDRPLKKKLDGIR